MKREQGIKRLFDAQTNAKTIQVEK